MCEMRSIMKQPKKDHTVKPKTILWFGLFYLFVISLSHLPYLFQKKRYLQSLEPNTKCPDTGYVTFGHGH